MKKLAAMILALILIFSLGAPAVAAERTAKQTDIFYREIKVMIDGEGLVPVDGDGKPIEPFIIDGTTYLPLRAVASALGLGVDWDNDAATAILTTGGAKSLGSGTPLATKGSVTKTLWYRDIKVTLDGKALTLLDSEGKTVEPFLMDDSTYLPLRAIATALGKDVDWDGDTSTAYIGAKPKTQPPSGETRWLLTGYVRYDKSTGASLPDVKVSYAYSAAGAVQSFTAQYNEGGLTQPTSGTFITDSAGRVTKEMDNDGYTTLYEYDAAGRLSRIEKQGYSNSTGLWDTAFVWNMEYDAMGRMTKRAYDEKYSDYDFMDVYYYDAAGRCVKTDVGGGTVWLSTYTLDSDDRPTEVVYTNPDLVGFGERFIASYDDNARTVTFERISTAAGSEFSFGRTVCSFDRYGNLLRIDDGTTCLEYTYAEYPGSAVNYISSYLQMGLKPSIDTNYNLLGAVFNAAPFANWY